MNAHSFVSTITRATLIVALTLGAVGCDSGETPGAVDARAPSDAGVGTDAGAVSLDSSVDPGPLPGADGGTVLGPSFAGVYEVPIEDDPTLKEAASYPVDVIRFDALADGSQRLQYDLPLALVGAKAGLEFRGSATSATTWELKEKDGSTASCTKDGPNVVCREVFTSVDVDIDRVKNELAKQGITGAAATAKVTVSNRFSVDPIGILRFSMP
jgi:hypothetical protein